MVPERRVLDLLHDGRAPHLTRVSLEVAATIPRHGDQEKVAQGWAFYLFLLLGVGRLGRGTFLLRLILAEEATGLIAIRHYCQRKPGW